MSEHMVQAKLAACVNIMSSGQSIYMWKGPITNGSENYLTWLTQELKAKN